MRGKIARTLAVAGNVALLVIAGLTIYISYQNYLKTDIRLEITTPGAGSAVLSKSVSVEGTVAGGPYDRYEINHKWLGQEDGLVSAAQGVGDQLASPLFPITLSLVDEDGTLECGPHAVTITLKSGSRTVQQTSVSFTVIDCDRVLPASIIAHRPIHDPIDLSTRQSIEGYDLLYYIDGTRWTLDYLDPVYLQDGYHELRVTAVIRGSEEEVNSFRTNFVVDNTPPIITCLGLAEGAEVNGRSQYIPTITDPHLAQLELCVDSEFEGKLEGEKLKKRLLDGTLGFTLEGGWRENTDAERTKHGRLVDGWHNVLIKASDQNGLSSESSVRVWVDNVCPDLQWDLAGKPVVEVLPSVQFWLGAASTDPEALISYDVDGLAVIADGGFLDTSRCKPGTAITVTANVVDRAGNTQKQTAEFVVEQSRQAWLNTSLRAVQQSISVGVSPTAALMARIASEGLGVGLGAEVSSSVADESKLIWRGVLDLVFMQFCPLLALGSGETMTLGVGFRIPLRVLGLTSPELTPSLVDPLLDFGTVLTPNWPVLNSGGFGTEQIAETWMQLSLPTVINIPLVAPGDAGMSLSVGPGCKLTYVQEFVREPVYVDGVITGVKRYAKDSVKLEVTVNASICFSFRNQR